MQLGMNDLPINIIIMATHSALEMHSGRLVLLEGAGIKALSEHAVWHKDVPTPGEGRAYNVTVT